MKKMISSVLPVQEELNRGQTVALLKKFGVPDQDGETVTLTKKIIIAETGYTSPDYELGFNGNTQHLTLLLPGDYYLTGGVLVKSHLVWDEYP